MAFMIPVYLLVAGCNVSSSRDDILARKPIIGENVNVRHSSDDLIKSIRKFSDQNGFAVKFKKIGDQNKGLFHATLFRDDIMITIATPFTPNSVNVSAFPLCSCEVDSDPYVRSIAKHEIENLTIILSDNEVDD